MKKYITSTLVLLLSLGFAQSVAAKSGACSGHGGVDCSAGRDSDGSVVCNDGWRNSSVSYASMVMCGSSYLNSRYAPTTPEPAKPKVVVPVKKIARTITRTNVRSFPATSGKVLGITPAKAAYEVLEQKNGWARIKFQGKNGWIMSNYVVIQ